MRESGPITLSVTSFLSFAIVPRCSCFLSFDASTLALASLVKKTKVSGGAVLRIYPGWVDRHIISWFFRDDIFNMHLPVSDHLDKIEVV